jgi:Tfp pilus assembly protein PilX
MVKSRGVLLLVAAVVMTVISVLTGAYFSSLVTEKRSTDDARLVLQALNLAEAGANQAVAELRKRIIIDLAEKVDAVTQNSVINAYVTANNPLGFLRDYAYSDAASKFTVSGSKAVLAITPLSLDSGVEGDVKQAVITITAYQAPTGSTVNETFSFYYTFSIEATGRITRYSPAIEKTITLSPNNFTLIVSRDNFAKYALFTNHHHTPANTAVWFIGSGNFSGPVHTNEHFYFAHNPSAHFADNVTQADANATFFNEGDNQSVDAAQYPANCSGSSCTDLPVFDQDFLRNQSIIALPTSVTQTQLKAKADPGNTVSGRGIWMPKNASNQLIGGIYINGTTSGGSADNDNPTIVLTVVSGKQVYTITRSTNTKKITVDHAANKTTVVNLAGSGGIAPGNYTGVPNGSDHIVNSTLIYTNDNIGYYDTVSGGGSAIAGLSGTVQQDTELTISSEKDLLISGNVTYEKDPTVSGNENYGNMLGLISWNGNVRIGLTAPYNMTLDAIIMAPNPSEVTDKGVFCVDNYNSGSTRGNANLFGGVITDYYGTFGTFDGSGALNHGYARNFVYDSRVLNDKIPPYFPKMDTFSLDVAPVNVLNKKRVWRLKEN